MKVDHIAGHGPHHVRSALSDSPAPDGATDASEPGDGGTDDAVDVRLSKTAQDYLAEVPGKSVAHRVRAALAAGLAEAGLPFGQLARQVAQGHDFFAAAEAVNTDDTEPTEPGTPLVDSATGKTDSDLEVVEQLAEEAAARTDDEDSKSTDPV